MADQQIINYGAAANDGQGDPLRVAFIKTDDNFDSIWATGPVGSNITILNNTISVVNTNGNLTLRPNGIGIIEAKNHIIPGLTRSYDLGSNTTIWRNLHANAVFAATADIGTANITNIGVLTVDVANLHISGGTNGYVLQTDGTGNLTWTAQTGGTGNGTPGGANTQVQYNDGGAFGGTAGFTFDNASNVLSVPGNVSAGNVLTSAEVIANGEIQSGTGFFTGGYLSVNGTADLHDATVTGNLTVDNNNNIWTFGADGNITLPADGGT